MWRIKNNLELHNAYKQPDIVNEIKIRRLKWLKHVIKMEDTFLPKMILNTIPEGRREVGRLNLRWLNDVEAVIETVGIKWLRVKVQDKKEWVVILREAKTKLKRALKPEEEEEIRLESGPRNLYTALFCMRLLGYYIRKLLILTFFFLCLATLFQLHIIYSVKLESYIVLCTINYRNWRRHNVWRYCSSICLEKFVKTTKNLTVGQQTSELWVQFETSKMLRIYVNQSTTTYESRDYTLKSPNLNTAETSRIPFLFWFCKLHH